MSSRKTTKNAASPQGAAQNTVCVTPPKRPPRSLRIAAGIAIAESIVVICFGIFLIIRYIVHADNESMVFSTSSPAWVGVGTAVFLFVCFGFVIVGACAMLRGKRWGRGAVVLLQFILAASSFQMMSAGATGLGVVVLVAACVTLSRVMFAKSSVEWAASHYTTPSTRA